MKSHQIFLKEVMDVKRWYLSTLYSYSMAKRVLKNQIDNKSYCQAIIDQAFDEPYSNPFALFRRIDIDNIKVCKELSVIRCISALEVYLISSVKEIFNENKSPFLNNNTITYHTGELLSFSNITDLHEDYINNICRQLHSQGFDEITKYYKRTFATDFNSFNISLHGNNFNIKDIKKYHDIRHLLVHRLGSTDEQFLKKYNTTGKTIAISTEEISDFFELLLSFSSYINKKLGSFLPYSSEDNSIEIKIELLEKDNLEFLEPTFEIRYQKIDHKFAEILKSIRYEGPEKQIVILNLHGDFSLIRRYYKKLNILASQGIIKIISYTNNDYQSKHKIKQYPLSEIEMVMRELPEQPWEKGLHKKIAQKFGWSNAKASNIINLLKAEQKTTIKLNTNELHLNVHEEYDLIATITPTEARYKYLFWKSTKPNIVNVVDGHIVAVSSGEAIISVRINVENSKAFCKVIVS